MTQSAIATAGTIVMLFPLGYFFLAAPGFLLAPLDIPQVATLLRGMFNAQFLMIGILGVIGTLAYAWAGRLPFAVVTGALALLAIWARPRFLRHWDAQRDAARKLRRLHVGGMAGNAAMLASLLGSIPYVVVV